MALRVGDWVGQWWREKRAWGDRWELGYWVTKKSTRESVHIRFYFLFFLIGGVVKYLS